MWSISTRVNKPENDDPSIVEPIAIATSAAFVQTGAAHLAELFRTTRWGNTLGHSHCIR